MISKVVISAGGKGERMGELSADQPKQLIEVAGRPFISYLLDNLVHAGAEQIILVVGHKKEAWTSFLSSLPFEITIVDQSVALGEKYGTACPIEAVEPLIGKESFISVNGDNLYSVPDLKRLFTDDGYIYVAGMEHEHPERFGVIIKNDDGLVERIVEKPSDPASNLINTGLYKFTPDIFPIVKNLTPSPRHEYEITDAINQLAAQGKVRLHRLRDYWQDFGRPEDIEVFERFIKEEYQPPA
jgi:dTDP-glucose pyrophosphorylase